MLLARCIKGLWVLMGITFASYVYFVGAITFSVIERQSIEQNVRELLSDISAQELEYLALDRELTKQEARSLGLSEAKELSFSARAAGFALNAER